MSSVKFTIEKSNAEYYKIRHLSGCYWADITIVASGESGRIQIASDFGDWQNFWSHCGMSFKKFLLKVDMDYVARKFGAKNYFDADFNIDQLKKEVINMRRNENLSATAARDIWDEIKSDLVDECSNNADHYINIIHQTEHIVHLYYDGYDVHKTYDPGFLQFWQKIWPVFLSELEKEISTPAITQ